MLRFLSLTLFLLICFATASAQSERLKVLPLGDSITQGGRTDRPEYTYRLKLFHLLVDAEVPFTFVGSMTEGLHADAEWPAYGERQFDLHHEGHYGWKTAAVAEHLPKWIQTWAETPDVALVHLGTNDQRSDDFAQDVVEPMRRIIAQLRAENPKIVVLLGHLNFNDGPALEIRPLIDALANELSTERSPVATVPHFRNWVANPDSPYSDTFDWAHPTPKGQEKMALRWMEAMQPYFPALQD